MPIWRPPKIKIMNDREETFIRKNRFILNYCHLIRRLLFKKTWIKYAKLWLFRTHKRSNRLTFILMCTSLIQFSCHQIFWWIIELFDCFLAETDFFEKLSVEFLFVTSKCFNRLFSTEKVLVVKVYKPTIKNWKTKQTNSTLSRSWTHCRTNCINRSYVQVLAKMCTSTIHDFYFAFIYLCIFMCVLTFDWFYGPINRS